MAMMAGFAEEMCAAVGLCTHETISDKNDGVLRLGAKLL
jgi:hypothetical protein